MIETFLRKLGRIAVSAIAPPFFCFSYPPLFFSTPSLFLHFFPSPSMPCACFCPSCLTRLGPRDWHGQNVAELPGGAYKGRWHSSTLASPAPRLGSNIVGGHSLGPVVGPRLTLSTTSVRLPDQCSGSHVGDHVSAAAPFRWSCYRKAGPRAGDIPKSSRSADIRALRRRLPNRPLDLGRALGPADGHKKFEALALWRGGRSGQPGVLHHQFGGRASGSGRARLAHRLPHVRSGSK